MVEQLCRQTDSQTDRQFGRKTHSEQLGCCATPTTLQMQRLASEEAPPKRLRPLATSPTNHTYADTSHTNYGDT